MVASYLGGTTPTARLATLALLAAALTTSLPCRANTMSTECAHHAFAVLQQQPSAAGKNGSGCDDAQPGVVCDTIGSLGVCAEDPKCADLEIAANASCTATAAACCIINISIPCATCDHEGTACIQSCLAAGTAVPAPAPAPAPAAAGEVDGEAADAPAEAQAEPDIGAGACASPAFWSVLAALALAGLTAL